MESEVLTLLNNIKVDGTPIGTLADANVYMMIVGGVFVMVIGVLGLCGAWNSIKECLWAVSIKIISNNESKIKSFLRMSSTCFPWNQPVSSLLHEVSRI